MDPFEGVPGAGRRADRIGIVVAEPAALLRELLIGLFDDAVGLEVVGSAATAADLPAVTRASASEVVLAAPSFGDSGLDRVLADVLRTGARVLIVCDASAAMEATALLLAGASGCLHWQDCSAVEIVAAARDVAAGNAALHPVAAAAVLAQWRAAREPGVQEPHGVQRQVTLSPREGEVLRALARGLPTKTIGRELALSPKTVEAHISRLLAKLDARNRAHAVSVAQSRGLLADGVVR